MAQETAFERASSGMFLTPGKKGTQIQLHRNHVEGLENYGVETYWTDILRIDVYQTHAEWVLRSKCTCGASMETYCNPDCETCDGLGNAPGKRIRVKHDAGDQQAVDHYINIEGQTMFWARQSGIMTYLRDKTPVYNLDVPPVVFHCYSRKDDVEGFEDMKISPEHGGHRMYKKRNYAYHDEFRKELVQIQLERLRAQQ
jgi:hypothetical protein